MNKNSNTNYHKLDVVSYSDYYPFGMLMPNRNGSESEYRYGFNGMEMDDEIKGEKNSLDYGARIYDPRVGQWLSIDPEFKKYSFMSPYVAFADNPIRFIDPNGMDIIDYISTLRKYSQYAFTVLSHSPVFQNVLSQWSNAQGDSKTLGFNQKGKFSDIKLQFETIGNNGTEGAPDVAGSSKVYYKGVELSKLEKIPSQMDLSDIKIVVQLNLDDYDNQKKTSEDLQDLNRTMTVIHETTLHAENQAKMISNHDADGKVNGKALVEDYIKRYSGDGDGPDHEALWKGEAGTLKETGADVSRVIKASTVYNELKRKGVNTKSESSRFEDKSAYFDDVLKTEQTKPKKGKKVKGK